MRIALYMGLMCMSLFASKVNLPVELKSWDSLSYVASAKNVSELKEASLTINKASYVGLVNTPKIQYIMRPTKEGGTVSYGGMFQIEIQEAGIYRISLGNASWIDLVKDGKAIISVAHNGGAENSGIRKMVDYPLEIGNYILQFSAGADSTTAVLITKIK